MAKPTALPRFRNVGIPWKWIPIPVPNMTPITSPITEKRIREFRIVSLVSYTFSSTRKKMMEGTVVVMIAVYP